MNNYTLLYAEDEDQTRLNYTKLFQRDFKEVYSCKDGQEAYKNYLEYKPNILLLDINMPKINGLELAKKIRQEDKQVRIIILTAHLEQDKLLLATELNLTKYLPKPISRSALKQALNLASTQYSELDNNTSIIQINKEFTWHIRDTKLLHNTKQIKLTKNETLFLELLSTNINNTFTIEQIAYHLCMEHDNKEINTKKIKDIIKRLRKKLPKNTITNIYSIGYQLHLENN
jgi:two-component system response regulator VanR